MTFPALSAALLLASSPSDPVYIARAEPPTSAPDETAHSASAAQSASAGHTGSALDPASDRNSIVVTARTPATPGDPLEKINAKSLAIAQDVDRAFVGPVALGYKKRVQEPVRDGLQSFLNSLHEPDVFLNFLLQLHPGKAG